MAALMTSGYRRRSHSSGAPLPPSDLRTQLQATLAAATPSGANSAVGGMARDQRAIAHPASQRNGCQISEDPNAPPMTRDEILGTLGNAHDLRRAFGVSRLSLFGSFARGEDRAESDIDVLVEFERPIGLFEFVRLRRRLEGLLFWPVDLVTPAALRAPTRTRILSEAIGA